jgi:hypothetical protein
MLHWGYALYVGSLHWHWKPIRTLIYTVGQEKEIGDMSAVSARLPGSELADCWRPFVILNLYINVLRYTQSTNRLLHILTRDKLVRPLLVPASYVLHIAPAAIVKSGVRKHTLVSAETARRGTSVTQSPTCPVFTVPRLSYSTFCQRD